jgi:hypothetical protein
MYAQCIDQKVDIPDGGVLVLNCPLLKASTTSSGVMLSPSGFSMMPSTHSEKEVTALAATAAWLRANREATKGMSLTIVLIGC